MKAQAVFPPWASSSHWRWRRQERRDKLPPPLLAPRMPPPTVVPDLTKLWTPTTASVLFSSVIPQLQPLQFIPLQVGFDALGFKLEGGLDTSLWLGLVVSGCGGHPHIATPEKVPTQYFSRCLAHWCSPTLITPKSASVTCLIVAIASVDLFTMCTNMGWSRHIASVL